MAKVMLAVAAMFALGRAADEDLDKAAAKAAEMGNYSCTATVKMEGGFGGGGGGGGGDRGAMPPVEMRVKADAPTHLKSGDVEVYRKGDVLAVKDGDAWKRLDPPERGQGGGGRGERPDRRLMAAQMLRNVKAPHEILKDLKSGSFKEVKREDAEKGRCYSGDLTAEAVKSFAQRPRRGGGGGGGNDRPEPVSTGTAKVWINGDGTVTKYEIHIETKMKNRNDEDVTAKRTTTVEIRDVGSTKYDVPEGAAKVFEAKKSEK